MRKLVLGTTLCVALGLPLGVETASAKVDDASAQRSCRLTATNGQLKLLRSTVVVENTVSPAIERISRRVNYTPAPNALRGREQAPYLALLDRQSKPVSLFVGVGF
jgi:hypothetical protein